MNRRTLVAVVWSATALFIAAPLAAQLPPDRADMLAHLDAAITLADAVPSALVQLIETQENEGSVVVGSGESAQTIGVQYGYRETRTERRSQTINGERRRLDRIFRTVEDRGMEGTERRLKIDAELRVIEGDVFVRARYRAPDAEGATSEPRILPDAPPLPEGWIVYNDDALERYPGLGLLEIDPDNTDDEVIRFELLEVLVREAVSIETEPRPEGGERIILHLDGAGARAFFEASAEQQGNADEPLSQALFGALREEDCASTMYIDIRRDGMFVGIEWALPVVFNPIELNTIEPDAPPGIFMEMVMDFSMDNRYLGPDEGPMIEAPPRFNAARTP